MITTWQKDEALTIYLAQLFYDREAGIQQGKNTFAGFQHVFPE